MCHKHAPHGANHCLEGSQGQSCALHTLFVASSTAAISVYFSSGHSASPS